MLETAKVNLRPCTGGLVMVIGTLNVFVKYLEGCGPNLLERDWLRVLTLNWKELFKIQVEKSNQECFKKDLGHSMTQR